MSEQWKTDLIQHIKRLCAKDPNINLSTLGSDSQVKSLRKSGKITSLAKFIDDAKGLHVDHRTQIVTVESHPQENGRAKSAKKEPAGFHNNVQAANVKNKQGNKITRPNRSKKETSQQIELEPVSDSIDLFNHFRQLKPAESQPQVPQNIQDFSAAADVLCSASRNLNPNDRDASRDILCGLDVVNLQSSSSNRPGSVDQWGFVGRIRSRKSQPDHFHTSLKLDGTPSQNSLALDSLAKPSALVNTDSWAPILYNAEEESLPVWDDPPSQIADPKNITTQDNNCDEPGSENFPVLHSSMTQNVPFFINTAIPFCLVTLGVQGSGKSHTVSTMLENCLLNCNWVCKTKATPKTLVCHFDNDENNFCEVATLTMKNKRVPHQLADQFSPLENLVILVSPSFYRQRKQFYASWPNCKVYPLLFRWKDLKASHLMSLMRLNTNDDDDTPLYMTVLLELLRSYQKNNNFPTFRSFKSSLEHIDYSKQQTGPLNQRISLLESLLADSEQNQSFQDTFISLADAFALENTMIIADLTDPMLSPVEANGIFQVLLSNFQSLTQASTTGKLVVFDEAHKYLTSSQASSKAAGLSKLIVQIVRQMRHHGIRTLISTQSPKSLPEELLELVSIAILHRFHSHDWFSYLQRKIPLPLDSFQDIMNLPTGEALMFVPRASMYSLIQSMQLDDHENLLPIMIRDRLTADGGRTVTCNDITLADNGI